MIIREPVVAHSPLALRGPAVAGLYWPVRREGADVFESTFRVCDTNVQGHAIGGIGTPGFGQIGALDHFAAGAVKHRAQYIGLVVPTGAGSGEQTNGEKE